ncbi:MAG TPA: nuclear transport factor 2 family protein [Rhizomicrobium sp.]|nr:nuclear transport factor 2 family protein [Rhizomicrobium sp.]
MADARQAVESYIAAWNENDPARIGALLEDCMAADCELASGQHAVSGRDALVAFVTAFRKARPGDRAVLTSAVETVGARFRFTGCGVDAEGRLYGEVMDVGELDAAGRIKWLTTFETPSPPPAA